MCFVRVGIFGVVMGELGSWCLFVVDTNYDAVILFIFYFWFYVRPTWKESGSRIHS